MTKELPEPEKSNHENFEVSDWVYVPGFGMAKITVFSRKFKATGDRTFTMVQTPMQSVSGMVQKSRGQLGNNRSPIAERIPFSPASGKEVFEEIIKQAYTPQDKQFDNIDQLIEHVGKLINSEDPVDVGRAWAYMAGRSNHEKIKEFAKQAINIFLSHRMYIDVILDEKIKLPNKKNLTQAGDNNVAILPPLHKAITPLVGETVTPPQMPENILAVKSTTPIATTPTRKKNPKSKRVKKQKKTKRGKTPPSEKPVEEDTKLPKESTVQEPEEAAEPISFEKPAEMTIEERQETALNEYFNEIAENSNEAQNNELYYLQLMLFSDEISALSFKQKYLILHELYGQEGRKQHVMSTINDLHQARKKLDDRNYNQTIGSAFTEFVRITQKGVSLEFESEEIKEILDADGAEDRVYDRIGERHFALRR